MEKRLNKKVEEYLSELKKNIKEKASDLNLTSETANDLITYIYDYERLSFTKDDFMKRKRVKNIVPYFDRCGAKTS